MSNYLVKDTALSYEAARIRAKTGSAAQITFDGDKGFGDAIDALPTGGTWELIADYTSDAAASIVEASIPAGKQNEDLYKVQIDTEFSSSEYPYFGANGLWASYESSRPSNKPITYLGFIARVDIKIDGEDVYNHADLVIAAKNLNVEYPITSVGIKGYYADKIKSGCRIRVWRAVE